MSKYLLSCHSNSNFAFYMESNNQIHFEISERKILLKLFDIIVIFISLYLEGLIFNMQYFLNFFTQISYVFVLLSYILGYGAIFEMYNLQVASNFNQITKSVLMTSFAIVISYLFTPIYSPSLPNNRIYILLFLFTVLFSLLSWRMFYLYLFTKQKFKKKVVLICDPEQLEELVLGLEQADPHTKVKAYLNTDTENPFQFNLNGIKNLKLDDLKSFLIERNISEIVIDVKKTEMITFELYKKLLEILQNQYPIKEYTQLYENISQRIPVQYLSRDFYRYFPFSFNNQNRLYLFYIKIFDLSISIIGIILFSSLIPFIYIINLFANKGPLFYSQERVGKNGKLFKIFKLRSMVTNAEKHGAVFAASNDARITPFGKILRKTRLDELPQFFNILIGDMSVIGPRPERQVFVDQIIEIMPFYSTRHIIKPGLTGWAQVNYSYGDKLEDSLVKLQYDLYYIKHRSIYLDINIILKTLSTVLYYRGQ